MVPKGQRESRSKQIEKLAESEGEEPEYQLPIIGELGYLAHILSEIGEGKISGERLTSISWVDLKAWIDVTGSEITAGEASALIEMSGVYVGQYYESMESNCPSPNIDKPKDKEVVANKIKSMFAMLR